MKLSAEIRVYGDPKELKACFEPELADKKRSNFKIVEKDDHILFEIEADDSVALRATMHGITKLITVYENIDKNG
ncbi:MAG: KEOPS complex subunit Pcc1 [Candidatus Woesearchaeota archaeon]